jgi:hypothetical protein
MLRLTAPPGTEKHAPFPGHHSGERISPANNAAYVSQVCCDVRDRYIDRDQNSGHLAKLPRLPRSTLTGAIHRRRNSPLTALSGSM